MKTKIKFNIYNFSKKFLTFTASMISCREILVLESSRSADTDAARNNDMAIALNILIKVILEV
jgi:hypothetical protein